MKSRRQNPPAKRKWLCLFAYLTLLPVPSDPAQIATANISAAKPSVSTSMTHPAWLPPDVDEKVPPVEETACSVDEVVRKAEERILEFVGNVDRFTATETLTHQSMVSIREVRQGHLGVTEYRNGGFALSEFPGGIVSTGLPTLVLIFHPYYAPSYEMTCEGLATLNDRLVWQVHFRQRPDKPNELKTYQYGIHGASCSVGLKGRAWISADSYQIVEMETDLVAPAPQIQLLAEYSAVEYGPVKFREDDVDLWLPVSAEVYFAWRGQQVHRRHSFDNYMLFTVNDKQRIYTPPTL
jgi:hypothetical protein